MTKWFSIAWLYHIAFIHSAVDGHLSCLPSLALMNNAAINVRVQLSVWTYMFDSLRYIPRSDTDGSNGNSTFYSLRNCQTVFQSDYTTLPSHQQCMRVQFLHILVNTCNKWPLNLFTPILVGVKRHLLVLLCIPSVTNDGEHLFGWLLATVFVLSKCRKYIIIIIF